MVEEGDGIADVFSYTFKNRIVHTDKADINYKPMYFLIRKQYS